MSPLAQSRMTRFAGLLFVAAGPRALADAPPGPQPPRVEPLAKQVVGVRPWEYESASPFGGSRMGGHDQRRFALSPDGKLLATEDAGGWQLELWDIVTGKSLDRFGKIEDPVALAFSPDGRTLVSACWSSHGNCPVEVWDVARRKRLHQLDEGVNLTPFTAVAFSPDGKTLALGGGSGRYTRGKFAIHLWDAASGEEVGRFDGPPFVNDPDRGRPFAAFYQCLCFSPDGRTLALVAEDHIYLWEVSTGKQRHRLGVVPAVFPPNPWFKERLACLAFSPDGRTLAVGCPDGAVRLWDVIRHAQLPPLVGHRDGLRAVRYAPDGKALWSVGWDDVVLTWPTAGPSYGWRPGKDKLAEQVLDHFWDDLASGDVLVRYAAVENLVARPGQAVPLLRRFVKPVPPAGSLRLDRLVADLDSEDYSVRRKAAVELRKVGDLAIPALRRASAKHADVTRRLLDQLQQLYPTPEQVQSLRAVGVLEQIGTEEAARLLDELAKGAPESLLTREAKAARDRIRPKG